MTKLKSLKKTMITCAAYVLLLAVLITGVTTAKYTDSATVLSSYGAASFNTVILGGRKDEEGNRIVEALAESLDAIEAYDFMPGMTYDPNSSDNTAKLYPFSVSNGVTEDNVSEIGVMFTLKLKTAANLPLVFSIKHGDTMLFTGQPTSVAGAEEGDADWQEYKFYTSTETMENGEEASFVLDGGALDYEDFTLVVEWPISSDGTGNSASEKYMKEIEMFELVVNSTSVSLEEYSTVPETPADPDGNSDDPADPADQPTE